MAASPSLTRIDVQRRASVRSRRVAAVPRAWLLAAALVAALVVVAQAPPKARGDDWTRWKAAIVTADAAPAAVVYCEGFTNGYEAGFGADFTTQSAQTLTAVRIRFDFYDAFGSIVQSEQGDVTGSFAPGVRIQRSAGRGWTVGALHFAQLANVAEVRCIVEKTIDEDGAVWTNPALAAPVGEQ